jgi:hypothetical protein
LHEPLTWNATLLEGDMAASVAALKSAPLGTCSHLASATSRTIWLNTDWQTSYATGSIRTHGGRASIPSLARGRSHLNS